MYELILCTVIKSDFLVVITHVHIEENILEK